MASRKTVIFSTVQTTKNGARRDPKEEAGWATTRLVGAWKVDLERPAQGLPSTKEQALGEKVAVLENILPSGEAVPPTEGMP